MIRRAIAAMVIALAAASAARGEFWMTVNGIADPPGGVWLEPNEIAVVSIHTTNTCAFWTNIIVLEGTGSVNLAGMSIIELDVDSDYIVDVTDDPDFREWLASIGYADPFAITYSELVSVIGACFPVPSGVMIDGIVLRGEAEGDITISLLDGADGTPLDRQVVHVGDEPPVPILQQGLVAHWELDEGAGLIAHDSAGDSNGIVYGAAWVSGQMAQALDFNGIDDYVDCGNDENLNLGTGDFSVSAWINPRSFGSDEPRPIISKWQDEANRWYLHTYNNCVEFTSKGQGSIVYVAGTEGLLNLDRWHHICFVPEGRGKIYVDGEDRTDWATHPPFAGSLDNTAAVKIGTNGSSETPTYFDGLIDDVRIYERNLSPGEVRRLYDVGVAGGGVIYVDGPNGSDNNDGLTRDTAFATIQKGIHSAWPGESVLVLVADGVYRGTGNRDLHLRGPVTLRSVNGPHLTVIDCDGNGHGISFTGPGDDKSVLDGFTITHCGTWEPYSMRGAIYVRGASPTISNCLISGNVGGLYGDSSDTHDGMESPRPVIANCTFVGNVGYAIGPGGGTATITNCICWDDELDASVTPTYCDVEGGWPGVGNIGVDPLFVDPCNADYRLSAHSPCIDTGNNAAPGLLDTDFAERARIVDGDCDSAATVDMGAYEFTPADAGDMDGDCDVDLPDLALLAMKWHTEAGGTDYEPLYDIAAPPNGVIGWEDLLVLSQHWLVDFIGYEPVPILRQGLVAHWELDEGEGLIACDSAGDSNAVVYGAAWASGQIGQALDFNGIGDYVDCGNDEDLNLGTGEFSISAWINPRSFGADEPRGIISKWQDEANRWYLHTYNDCVEFTSKGQGGVVYAAGTEGLLDLDRWHHISFVAQDKGKIYLDGEDQTDWATHPPFAGSLDNTAAVTIGFNGSAETPTYFDGSIDDVRIYERNLSPGEVRRLYDVGTAGGGVFYVDGPNGDDDNDGLTRDTAFATIQRGINSAWHGDTVIVAEGTYTGARNKNLDFHGLAMTLKSAAGPGTTIIDCQDSGRAFYFRRAEGPDSVVDGFTITGGSAASSVGGGIYAVYHASPTIRNCIISRNHASYGGGIFGSATIRDCLVSGNYANYGGGICGSATIRNCIVSGNYASQEGGGMSGGSAYIVNCTFVGNEAARGHAIDSNTSITIVNSIVWANRSSNVVLGKITASYCDIEGGWGGAGNIDVDPRFVDPGNGDYRLGANSPCIDAGDNAAAGLPDTDLAGRARIIDGDCDGAATVDMGAYEFNPN